MKNTSLKSGIRYTLLYLILILNSSIGIASDPKKLPEKGPNVDQLFIENKGQLFFSDKKAAKEILFKASGNGADIYFQKDRISYVLSKVNYKKSPTGEKLL